MCRKLPNVLAKYPINDAECTRPSERSPPANNTFDLKYPPPRVSKNNDDDGMRTNEKTLPAMGALSYISFKLHSKVRATMGKNSKLTLPMLKDVISPLAIAFGIFCMYRGRRFVVAAAVASATVASSGVVVENAILGDGIGAVVAEAMTTTAAAAAAAATTTTYLDWSWTFWFGEALVMSLFVSNSFEKHTRSLVLVYVAVSLLCTLWLRGRFWRYASVLLIEAIIALACVVIFPIMEMILESIVEEKMRKVGEKIRAHDRRMRELLTKKKKEQGGGSS